MEITMDKIPSLQSATENFINEIKKLKEQSNSESDFDDYLCEHVAPILNDRKEIYDCSVLEKLELTAWINKSVLDQTGVSLKGSLFSMNNDGICWLLEHINSINQVLALFEPYGDKDDKERRIKSLTRHTDELQDWLNGELFERIQNYKSEIEILRKPIEAD